MALKKLIISDLDLKGKKVFIRVDFNVPFDDQGNISDDTRIRAALPTIKKAIEMGGKVILASHRGRPKGKVDPKFTLKPVAARLQEILGRPVAFAPDCIGPEVEKMAADMKEGDVMLLENVRFHPQEEKNDPEFSKALAKLADVYVNDAFGTAHRAHATTEGITKYVSKAAAGFLMEKELDYLINQVDNAKKPFVAIVGGFKVSSKIGVLDHLASKVNTILIGGAMANTFFKAMGYDVGDSPFEEEMLEVARKILQSMKDKKVDFKLPTDCVIAKQIEEGAETQTVAVDKVTAGWKILDIGPDTTKVYCDAVLNAQTILWNGPMGVFEVSTFAKGTFDLAKAVAKSPAVSIIGGGDSVLAVNRAGVEKDVSFISTGGGASLELLEGKVLPGVAALTSK